MHYLGAGHELLVCEFEFQDYWHAESPAMPSGLTSTPYNTLDSDPLDAASSLGSRSQPLNIALSTSDIFTGDGRAMEVLNVMSQIQRQLSVASSVHDLLEIIVGVVHELTAFHCCMIYQIRSILQWQGCCRTRQPSCKQ